MLTLTVIPCNDGIRIKNHSKSLYFLFQTKKSKDGIKQKISNRLYKINHIKLKKKKKNRNLKNQKQPTEKMARGTTDKPTMSWEKKQKTTKRQTTEYKTHFFNLSNMNHKNKMWVIANVV